MLVVPIAFVSEHTETLVELDVEYRELAERVGVPGYFRVPAPNADAGFHRRPGRAGAADAARAARACAASPAAAPARGRTRDCPFARADPGERDALRVTPAGADARPHGAVCGW